MVAPSVRACSTMKSSVEAIAELRAIPLTAAVAAAAVALDQRLAGLAARPSRPVNVEPAPPRPGSSTR